MSAPARTVVRPTFEAGGARLRLDVDLGGPTATVVLTADRPLAADRGGDAALAAALLPAMTRGGVLEVDAPVSPRLAAAVGGIQEVFLLWEREGALPAAGLRPVEVRAPSLRQPRVAGVRTGLFFSAGVDSLFAAVERRGEIDDLLFVHGMDLPLDEPALRAQVVAGVRRAAAAVGRPLREVETDLRTLTDPLVPWNHAYGAGLAMVAHALGGDLAGALLASGHTWANLVADGSHPVLDGRWSSETTVLSAWGLHATRVDKLRRLAAEPGVLEDLRVCWRNEGGRYNCGRCEKCLRTVVALHLAGADGRCATLPARPDEEAVAALRLGGSTATLWAEVLRELERQGREPALERAVRAALAAGPGRRRWWARRPHRDVR